VAQAVSQVLVIQFCVRAMAQAVSRVLVIQFCVRAMAQAVSLRPLNAEARSTWDFWWTKWHWDRVFSVYFGFPLSILFHRCSIEMEKQKKTSLSSSSSSS
jgi:hypothetical protein